MYMSNKCSAFTFHRYSCLKIAQIRIIASLTIATQIYRKINCQRDFFWSRRHE